MKKILIATHGEFARGAVTAANIILGDKDHVICINAYTEGIILKDEITKFFAEVQESDVVLVLTDMFGGSVNQALMPYIKHQNMHLITGFNLALLLEVLMLDEQDIQVDKLRGIVADSQKQIMYVNDVLSTESNDDFDF